MKLKDVIMPSPQENETSSIFKSRNLTNVRGDLPWDRSLFVLLRPRQHVFINKSFHITMDKGINNTDKVPNNKYDHEGEMDGADCSH